MRQICASVPREVCTTVDREVCATVPTEKCADVPREVCETKCEDVFWCKVRSQPCPLLLVLNCLLAIFYRQLTRNIRLLSVPPLFAIISRLLAMLPCVLF